MSNSRLFFFGAVAIAAGLSNFNPAWMSGVGGVAMVLIAIFR